MLIFLLFLDQILGKSLRERQTASGELPSAPLWKKAIILGYNQYPAVEKPTQLAQIKRDPLSYNVIQRNNGAERFNSVAESITSEAKSKLKINEVHSNY